MKNISDNSRFIGFLDECGDHSLEKIDRDFPIFVLCLAIVERETYAETIIPAMSAFTLRYWNHEGINLHSRHIRKAVGAYSFLQVPQMRTAFATEISSLMVFWDKRANIAGLQMADLAAYPCARHILKPVQKNQAFDIIKNKIYQSGNVKGWKVFP